MDAMPALEQNRAAIGIADTLGGAFDFLPAADGHAGQNFRLRDIRRDQVRQGKQAGFQDIHRLFGDEPVSAGRHHHRIGHDVPGVVELQPFRNCFYQAAGGRHADFHRVRRDILKHRVHLLAQKFRGQLHNGPYAGGILCDQSGDDAHGKNAVHGHGFQIGLNPGPSAGVRPGD